MTEMVDLRGSLRRTLEACGAVCELRDVVREPLGADDRAAALHRLNARVFRV